MTALTLDIAPETQASDGGLDDGVTHVYCCDDIDLALCGTDITDDVLDEESPTSCVVCADLDDTMDALDSCATVCPKRAAVAR